MTVGPPASVPSPIVIDGPAASGKSTVGAALAARYGFLLFDTGVTYRAFTLTAIERAVSPADERACASLASSLRLAIHGDGETRISVDGVDVTDRLREPAVEHTVSAYSAIASVRRVMVSYQRQVAATQGVVVIGRDIGTVVLPDAPVKMFLTATDEQRAHRRALQSGQWGQAQDAIGARADIGQRDQLDSSRAVSPLRPADDAIVIDTTEMTLDDVVRRAIEVVEGRRR